jgi:hypothetical protein
LLLLFGSTGGRFGRVREKGKEGSATFLKKSSKKLLIPRAVAVQPALPQRNQKFFAALFLKKRPFAY